MWYPSTQNELARAIERCPGSAHRWRPAADQIGTLGEQLALAIGEAPPAMVAEQFQESFLQTLAADEQFRAAVKNLLNRGVV